LNIKEFAGNASAFSLQFESFHIKKLFPEFYKENR